MTTKATILKAIRAQCIECMGNQPFLIEGCTSPKCSLYPYRSGKDPRPSKKVNPDNIKKAQAANASKRKTVQVSTNEAGGGQ